MKKKNKYVPPSISVIMAMMGSYLMQGSVTQGNIHSFDFVPDAWESPSNINI